MKFHLGVTDNHWFTYLSTINPEDVNFWQPGGNLAFRALPSGAPFLFKLKAPLNVIGGVGFFSSHIFLPISIAWDTFGSRNGFDTFEEFRRAIISNRQNKTEINPQIGCIVLNDPVFFKPEDWIAAPENWAKNIVTGKGYSTDEPIGDQLWNKVDLLLRKYMTSDDNILQTNSLFVQEPSARYDSYGFRKIRIGQGAFRVLVTDSYDRRCSITGEKTLPVLESAHIQSYSKDGPNTVSNGILLRSDIHKLFDTGYLTITKDHKVEVSSRIKEEFLNGKEYYQYHGKDLLVLPQRLSDRPHSQYIEWHNSIVYKG